ncbi:MAG TPA: crosslink repair DNA glycosylase YcaQ family protein, partial [Candidatus Limnocylindrales bacterium]|nr:crosslink repair DNA glycosylase YcaQ family protein [Candidatus Limnocylindrales bacterium]
MGEAPAAPTWADVRRRRLAAGRLTSPAEPPDGGTIAGIVGQTCGVHAQLMPTAELSIGLRVRGATRTTVRDALWTERTLVRTYGLRGTVHLFPASELALWLAALRALPAPERRQRDRLASLGVTPDEAEGIVAAIGRAVEGRRLTLTQLEAEVAGLLGGHVAERRGNAFGS